MKSLLMLLGMTCVVSAVAVPPAAHLKAAYEHSFEVALPAAEAFTLFEPLGEKRWAADWQPVFASPGDARLHDGSVFTVEYPGRHGGARMLTVWTITRYEPARAIEYHNVLPGLRTSRIKVALTEVSGRRTRVTVSYIYTGLSAPGDDAIRQITPETYRKNIESWGSEIAAYLKRGTPASP